MLCIPCDIVMWYTSDEIKWNLMKVNLLKQTECGTNTASVIVLLKFTCVALVSCSDINCSFGLKLK
jgi:hypothetical protein